MSDEPSVAAFLEWQAASCAEMGSPLYAAILAGAAQDVTAGGPVAEILAAYRDDPPGSAVALRWMAALHRQVLRRTAPELALHFPSVGGEAGIDGAWPAARELCARRTAEIAADVARPCQTNEPGRAAALLVGLLAVAADTPGRGIELLEIGASAGLGLQVDRYGFGALGPRDPVLVAEPWAGPPPTGRPYEIVARAGCDLAPLDPTDAGDRLSLTSSVWADQLPRFERLRAALSVAAAHPVRVERAGAGHWLRERLARGVPGTVTVVWHSIVWTYLPEPEREAVLAALSDPASSALRPVVHLAYEFGASGPGEPSLATGGVQLVATSWPGGDARRLAEGGGHGPPVRLAG